MESGAPKAGTWCRVRMPESESIVKRALFLHVPITTVPLKRTNSSRTYPIFIERSVQKVLLEMISYSILSRLDTQ